MNVYKIAKIAIPTILSSFMIYRLLKLRKILMAKEAAKENKADVVKPKFDTAAREEMAKSQAEQATPPVDPVIPVVETRFKRPNKVPPTFTSEQVYEYSFATGYHVVTNGNKIVIMQGDATEEECIDFVMELYAVVDSAFWLKTNDRLRELLSKLSVIEVSGFGKDMDEAMVTQAQTRRYSPKPAEPKAAEAIEEVDEESDVEEEDSSIASAVSDFLDTVLKAMSEGTDDAAPKPSKSFGDKSHHDEDDIVPRPRKVVNMFKTEKRFK